MAEGKSNGKKSKIRSFDDWKPNFVVCDVCDRLELFENCGLGKVFDEKVVRQISLADCVWMQLC